MTSMINEFLSNSSIHGLVHINNAKSGVAKAAWIVILTIGFGIAAYLIANSYAEWTESPVSTVITPHSISDLEFPEVTVCPPKGSNTVLNQAFKKITNKELTPELKKRLKNMINKLFFLDPSKAFGKSMAQIVNLWSSKDIQERNIQFPEKTADSIHFQVNISAMENLTFGTEAGRKWKYSWQEERFKLYKDKGAMTFTDAEAFCVSQGGHLASIQSEEENAELLKAAGSERVWLGGSDGAEEGRWVWTDGKSWNFTNWSFGKPDNENNSDCMVVENAEFWHDTPCSIYISSCIFVCSFLHTTNGTQNAHNIHCILYIVH